MRVLDANLVGRAEQRLTVHLRDGQICLGDVVVLDEGEAGRVLRHPNLHQLSKAAKLPLYFLLLGASDAADEDAVLRPV